MILNFSNRPLKLSRTLSMRVHKHANIHTYCICKADGGGPSFMYISLAKTQRSLICINQQNVLNFVLTKIHTTKSLCVYTYKHMYVHMKLRLQYFPPHCTCKRCYISGPFLWILMNFRRRYCLSLLRVENLAQRVSPTQHKHTSFAKYVYIFYIDI